MKRYFAILSNQKDTPTQMHNVENQRFVLFDEIHPSPEQVKEVIRKYKNYAFIYLFKGDFNILSKDNIQFLKYEFIRKYNCSSFGLADAPCKD